MDGADVLVGAGLGELSENVSSRRAPGTEHARQADDRVRLAVVIVPGHGRAGGHGHRHRIEPEVLDDDDAVCACTGDAANAVNKNMARGIDDQLETMHDLSLVIQVSTVSVSVN